MKKIGFLYLLALLCLSNTSLDAQRFSHIIHQELSQADLLYMPAEDLNVLKNEIIALKGAEAMAPRIIGNTDSPYFNTADFLGSIDQKNIDLIELVQGENREKVCSRKELYEIFYQLASTQKEMPLYLAQEFYGISLSKEMSKHQKVLQMEEGIMGFWVPQFSTCEDCPYMNHFITINTTEGEVVSQLKVEGLITINEDKTLEIKPISSSVVNTTTQPEYYQITADGQLIFTGSQVVQAEQN